MIQVILRFQPPINQFEVVIYNTTTKLGKIALRKKAYSDANEAGEKLAAHLECDLVRQLADDAIQVNKDALELSLA